MLSKQAKGTKLICWIVVWILWQLGLLTYSICCVEEKSPHSMIKSRKATTQTDHKADGFM